MQVILVLIISILLDFFEVYNFIFCGAIIGCLVELEMCSSYTFQNKMIAQQ